VLQVVTSIVEGNREGWKGGRRETKRENIGNKSRKNINKGGINEET